MKKLFSLLTTLVLVFSLNAQSPSKFNYQAVIRNPDGSIRPNQTVNVQIGILQGNTNGNSVYVENHNITSTVSGLINLIIGDGTIVSGSMTTINWSKGPYFLKTTIDGQLMGTSQLLSVPYALFADKANKSDKLEVNENPNLSSDSALFIVRDKLGQPVFAVYETGVQISYNLNPHNKGAKSGFTVGGRTTGKGSLLNIMKVTTDSVRIYVDTANFKGARGGFVVGGRNPSKGSIQDLLNVQTEQTKIYTRGDAGGFTIQNIESGNNLIRYTNLTKSNCFIGYNSGMNNSSGYDNIFFGSNAGYHNTSAFSNIFIGNQSGYSVAEANNNQDNIFIGNRAGENLKVGSDNVFFGSESGNQCNNSQFNAFVGAYTGYKLQQGNWNFFGGPQAGRNLLVGDNNVFIGSQSAGQVFGQERSGNFSNNVFVGSCSGEAHEAGDGNTYVGAFAGIWNVSGSNNVWLGESAGHYNTSGSNNIFIGGQAGASSHSSNTLLIENSDLDSTKALIWGDFSNPMLRFNGKVGIGITPTANFEVHSPDDCCYLSLKGQGAWWGGYSMLLFESSINGMSSYKWIFTHGSQHSFNIQYRNSISNAGGVSLAFDTLGDVNLPAGKLAINQSTIATQALDVNGNGRFRAVSSGSYASNLNITSDGTLTTSTSDARLKENIQPINDGLAKISALQGVSFNWISDDSKSRRIGLIAQEVEKVIPELVFTNHTDGYKGINYAELNAVLIEAVKEQQVQISTAMDENRELKANLQKMQNQIDLLKEYVEKNIGSK